uniref:ATP synthase F0 subunit 8 n=1 Tax=Haementeria acuecueyetzin TaxID=1130134 RepID=A0A7D7KTE3_9ANNE|nr:ATP synthase F0 subunit 8 [Haementeria acuecueyetzin]
MPHLSPMNWITFLLLTWLIITMFITNTWWSLFNYKTCTMIKNFSMTNYWKW